jgi:DNA repair protein RecN (Recombination protein N)
MLLQLTIKNYALIDSLDIEPGAGLNILTGETGSGKSIILGALGLLLGERAESRIVQEGKSKCVVEGSFDLQGKKLQKFFLKHAIDYENLSTVRREILSTGKSRAFVNDTPVNLKLLKSLGMRLIDIHSQHQTLQVNDARFQLNVIDSFAKTATRQAEYGAAYAKFSLARKALDAAISEDQNARNNLDFIRFQLKELEAVDLDGLDQTALDEELSMLANADAIAGGLGKAFNALSEAEVNVRGSLREAIEGLQHISAFARQYAELHERLKSAEIELDDVAREVEALLGKVEVDPQRLTRLENVQNTVFRLEQKHGLQGVGALCGLRDDLRKQVKAVDHFDEQLEELRQAESAALEAVNVSGKQLSDKRLAGIPALRESIVKVLKSLNMPHAILDVKLEPLADPSAQGLDRAAFYFSANAGQKPALLKEVASGGELSRLMLAIKHITASGGGRGTIVFDEIDTGVSGEVAHSMGRIMRGMASDVQVICITHLPQIAAKGSTHFKVFKKTEDGHTLTEMCVLDEAERVQEIAQMLSGAKTTDAALANARELLSQD